MAAAYLLGRSVGVASFCAKAPYATRKAARQALTRISGDKVKLAASVTGRIHVYKCLGCRGWHVGHR